MDIPDRDRAPVSYLASISSITCFCIKRQLLNVSSNSVASLISVREQS